MRVSNKILKVCSTAFLASTIVVSAGASVFATAKKDIGGHWAETQISKWVDKGYIAGYNDDTFKPNNSITRAEFITLVNKSFGFTTEASIEYKDVKQGQWFYNEVAKAKAAGYISGYNDGTMKPNNQITRQEAAVIIEKLLNLNVEDAESKLGKFIDANAIAGWSKSAVGEVVGKGIMNGYPDSTFKPKNNITRAEAVFTLDKALELSGNTVTATTFDKAGTYGPESGAAKTIEGDVVIGASDVKLQNTVITGNLVVAESVGEGTVRLSNVTVKGTTTVKGGGADSVYAEDSTFEKVVVDKKSVHLVASGKTTASDVILQSAAKVEQGKLSESAKGFSDVTIESVSDGTVELVGSFDNVTVEGKASIQLSAGIIENLEIAKGAKGATVKLSSDTTIKTFVANDEVSVSGTGKIETAKVNVNGVRFENKPANVQLATGVEISTGTVSGGGGGGSDTTTEDDKKKALKGEMEGPINIHGKYNGQTISELTKVNGDVTITANNFTLKNTVITGDLTMTAANNISLEGVEVQGRTILK